MTTSPTTASTTSATSVTDTDTDTGTDSGSDSSGTSGGEDVCIGLPRDQCAANAACTPIACNLFTPTMNAADPWCLAPPSFIGCRSAAAACADQRTVTCEGNNEPIYTCADTCIPDGWTECAPPAMGVGNCP